RRTSTTASSRPQASRQRPTHGWPRSSSPKPSRETACRSRIIACMDPSGRSTACAPPASAGNLPSDQFGARVLILWPLEPVVVAQRRALVLVPEQTPAAQLRDHLVDERLQVAGQCWRHDVEAVARALADPLLDRVGELLGGAGQRAVAAAPAELCEQLAHRQLLAAREIGDQRRAALEALDLILVRNLG